MLTDHLTVAKPPVLPDLSLSQTPSQIDVCSQAVGTSSNSSQMLQFQFLPNSYRQQHVRSVQTPDKLVHAYRSTCPCQPGAGHSKRVQQTLLGIWKAPRPPAGPPRPGPLLYHPHMPSSLVCLLLTCFLLSRSAQLCLASIELRHTNLAMAGIHLSFC